jgi:hypothetical protein
MASISQTVGKLIKSTLLVVILGPLLIGLLYIVINATSLSNTRSQVTDIAQEIQADFNDHYPETLEGYKDWRPESESFGYTSAKAINSFVTDSLMYKPINNGGSFELAFIYMVDIYRFGPVDGKIQEL